MADDVELGVRRLQQELAAVERMGYPPHLARQAMAQAFEFLEEPTRRAVEALAGDGYHCPRLVIFVEWGGNGG